MLAGQAEHRSAVHSEVFAFPMIMVSFCQQALTATLPSHCLPPSDVGLEFEMFALKALLLSCLHDVHVRCLFDALFSQGMEIETLCSKGVVLFRMSVSVLHLGERFHTPQTLYW